MFGRNHRSLQQVLRGFHTHSSAYVHEGTETIVSVDLFGTVAVHRPDEEPLYIQYPVPEDIIASLPGNAWKPLVHPNVGYSLLDPPYYDFVPADYFDRHIIARKSRTRTPHFYRDGKMQNRLRSGNPVCCVEQGPRNEPRRLLRLGKDRLFLNGVIYPSDCPEAVKETFCHYGLPDYLDPHTVSAREVLAPRWTILNNDTAMFPPLLDLIRLREIRFLYFH